VIWGFLPDSLLGLAEALVVCLSIFDFLAIANFLVQAFRRVVVAMRYGGLQQQSSRFSLRLQVGSVG